MKFLVLIGLTFLFLGVRAEATNYTVKAAGGGDFTTISSCAAKAVAGDTCTVFAGSYAGWTQSANGSAGNPITFTVNTGDTVTITSGVTISSRSYITISKFTFSSGGVTGNGTTNHNIIDQNTFNGTSSAFRIDDGQGSNGSDNVFSNNTITSGSTGNVVGIYLYGDRNRIENNTIIGTDGDCMDLGGMNVVVRDNVCKNLDGGVSGQHIDFIQVIGDGTIPTLSFSLIEGNTEQNCTNDGYNCHFFMVRTGSGPVADTNIVRYNFAQNLDGSGASFGGIGDSAPNNKFYNNTIATEKKNSENGDCASWQYAPNGTAVNNICYNVIAASSNWAPFYDFNASGGGLANDDSNLNFTSGYSGGWGAPYTPEPTYSVLHSKDPLFANYPTDASLQAGSPARGAGHALTAAVGSGSSKSLTVTDSHFFQQGWAGAQPDWIRIGSSTTVQISSINYSTNVITLATAASWNNGDPIYLYKDSKGNTVLNGANPDVGSYYDAGSNNPTPPTNLQAVVN